MRPETAERLRALPKGDALATAQVAGIMAAKRTSELIPLCHPLPLSHVDVRLEVGDGGVGIEASAETTAQTGVEMEALTAATVAASRSTTWRRRSTRRWSSRTSACWRRRRRPSPEGRCPDRLGRRLCRRARGPERRRPRRAARRGGLRRRARVVPDERPAIAEAVRELAASAQVVLTTGGTGFGPRDVTPEATTDVLDRVAPGIAEAVRADSIANAARPALPRSGRRRGLDLVVNLPGSPGGARDGFEVLRPALCPAVGLLAGEQTAHRQT